MKEEHTGIDDSNGLIGNFDAYKNPGLFLPVVIHDLPEKMVIQIDNFPQQTGRNGENIRHAGPCTVTQIQETFTRTYFPVTYFLQSFPATANAS